MFIRKATLDDLAEIIRIYDEIHAREEAGEVTTGWLRDIYPTRKTAESSIERGDMFVQENEAGEIVGTGIINQTQVDVYADGDWQFPAANEKIMVARVREFDFDQINSKVDELIKTSRLTKPFTTVILMKQLVPEYISNNSIYEQLDPQ